MARKHMFTISMSPENSYKCRTCLSENTSELFSWSTPLDEENCEVTYMDCYRECTLLEAHSDDQLPQAICYDCAEQMRDAYYFIQRAKESLKTLMLELESSSLVQTEFEWVTVKEDDEEFMTLTSPSAPRSLPTAELKAYKGSPESCEIEIMDEDFLRVESSEDSESPDTKSKETQINKNRNRSSAKKKPAALPPDTLVTCEDCGITVAKRVLRFHRYRKHRPKTLLCDACPLVFGYPSDLQIHAQTHEKDRPRKFTCEKCGQKFMMERHLRDHAKIHEPNRKPQFKCEFCEKSFFFRGYLNQHKRVHTSERHKCEICSKEYVRAIELKYHMERTHSGERPFKCTRCEKAYTNVSALNKHLASHDGVVYKCKVCHKQYVTQSGLIRHRREHTGLPFKCSICEKGFTERNRAKRHIAGVHKASEEESENLIIRLKTKREFRGRIIEV